MAASLQMAEKGRGRDDSGATEALQRQKMAAVVGHEEICVGGNCQRKEFAVGDVPNGI
jgi:hypothetical protein